MTMNATKKKNVLNIISTLFHVAIFISLVVFAFTINSHLSSIQDVYMICWQPTSQNMGITHYYNGVYGMGNGGKVGFCNESLKQVDLVQEIKNSVNDVQIFEIIIVGFVAVSGILQLILYRIKHDDKIKPDDKLETKRKDTEESKEKKDDLSRGVKLHHS